MANRKMRRGDEFWEWTVIDPARRIPGRTREDGTVRTYAAALVECSCSTPENPVRKVIYQHHLRSGNTKSCGHYRASGDYRPARPVTARFKARCRVSSNEHEARRVIRGIWNSIKERCFNANVIAYKDYGGRGITLWGPWVNDSDAFIDWVMENLGPRPEGHSIDRIDVNGNYRPGNLRWSTPSQQMSNTRAQLDPMNGIVRTPKASTWGYVVQRGKEKYAEYGFTAPEDAAAARNAMLGVLNDSGPDSAREHVTSLNGAREAARRDAVESARRAAGEAKAAARQAAGNARRAAAEAAELERRARWDDKAAKKSARAQRWHEMNETMTLADIARTEGVTVACVSTELKRHGYAAILRNAAGYPGVKRTPHGTYEARMVIDGKRVTLGTAKTPEEAHALYTAARAGNSGSVIRAETMDSGPSKERA